METRTTDYYNKYGNFLYVLNIELEKGIGNDEKSIILSTIYDLLNEKDIEKDILNTNVCIKWRVYDNTDLYHYYTDAYEIFGDKAVYEHTKLLFNEIKQYINYDKLKIYITKPLTKSICII
jgi:hypothetical protein